LRGVSLCLNDRSLGDDEKSISGNIFAKQGPFSFYHLGSILKVNLILSPLANKTQVRMITLASFQ
jgi:hypothetical protein